MNQIANFTHFKPTGSGGIGLAAIRIALAYGLEVFTTVSTQQKRKFILGLFPQLKGMSFYLDNFEM